MLDKELINKIKIIKQQKGYTLFDISRIVDVQISTIERWLKTSRINKVYAKLVKEKLEIL
ncbi:MAG: hypothetical protein PHR84_06555 [Candidatus Omnitrophica bacterium]|nr:hypothetical protein [Candidatus Omnitrophota bacterium]MDD5661498.1 hypothetical protein [Candidatus Omnitrophota bacterium]